MLDDRHIVAASDFISKADSWGTTSLNIFYMLIILVTVFFFLWFIVGKVSKVIDRNSETQAELLTAIQANTKLSEDKLQLLEIQLDKARSKQDIIHDDIKKILYRYDNKFGLNTPDYDIKG